MNNQFVFDNKSTGLDSAVFSWDFGDNATISSATDTSASHKYIQSGNYFVTLKITNRAVCTAQSSVSVLVVPKPIASFDLPAIVCQNETGNLTDKSYVTGNSAPINNWWWDIDGSILQTPTPPSFIKKTTDSLSVSLVVTSQDGCISDTDKVIVPVYQQPIAAYSLSTPLCNNTLTNFINLSTLVSSPKNETISTWNWQFNGGGIVNDINPSEILPKGNNKASLVIETNFGCKSTSVDTSFYVNHKPDVSLSINDSCINRDIVYSASDALNETNKWNWNFGKGYFMDLPTLRKNYDQKDSFDIILIAENKFGCTDTITRPFEIYDNIAFAGNDTIAAKGEPIQLNANGYAGTKYNWSPPNGLSSDTIINPIATLDVEETYKLYALTKEGCDKYSQIVIKRYSGPELYIPTAFTPGKQTNNVLRVFPVGIKSFAHFSVYNRFGQLLFNTKDYNIGWDGTINGAPADFGTYVAIAESIDYTGKPMIAKNTVVLLR